MLQSAVCWRLPTKTTVCINTRRGYAMLYPKMRRSRIEGGRAGFKDFNCYIANLGARQRLGIHTTTALWQQDDIVPSNGTSISADQKESASGKGYGVVKKGNVDINKKVRTVRSLQRAAMAGKYETIESKEVSLSKLRSLEETRLQNLKVGMPSASVAHIHQFSTKGMLDWYDLKIWPVRDAKTGLAAFLEYDQKQEREESDNKKAKKAEKLEIGGRMDSMLFRHYQLCQMVLHRESVLHQKSRTVRRDEEYREIEPDVNEDRFVDLLGTYLPPDLAFEEKFDLVVDSAGEGENSVCPIETALTIKTGDGETGYKVTTLQDKRAKARKSKRAKKVLEAEGSADEGLSDAAAGASVDGTSAPEGSVALEMTRMMDGKQEGGGVGGEGTALNVGQGDGARQESDDEKVAAGAKESDALHINLEDWPEKREGILRDLQLGKTIGEKPKPVATKKQISRQMPHMSKDERDEEWKRQKEEVKANTVAWNKATKAYARAKREYAAYCREAYVRMDWQTERRPELATRQKQWQLMTLQILLGMPKKERKEAFDWLEYRHTRGKGYTAVGAERNSNDKGKAKYEAHLAIEKEVVGMLQKLDEEPEHDAEAGLQHVSALMGSENEDELLEEYKKFNRKSKKRKRAY
ncbi:hypothetical protein SARC_01146 [Sphaeroforma arctica JP610]|uniref:Uncharacterized protein n=1 Tax=Sphaeroforma arctica JP610 TaxID=667725 RepID=A0A0L0GCV9_9EUKA|nr:hypothetical protein SARC_01146 [Sphaeroforma arctica JP610]KNC86726.1 hypothetical protein SARC_01146 [Sphaeroforma arctica JP610]|eukprot:XP_014160628.1 hypothetical protein SARC_01146 [Sphaeroforma arctica JP610]